MKTCIVIPTYNERENISNLIPQLIKVFIRIKKHQMHILVVDDNSPDGTADVVKKFSKKHRNIHLLTGQKQGLGAAYIRGFQHTINKYDILFMMDADFSHNPNKIPVFLKHIEQGYDFVIGSRYVPGGATPDWGASRKLISWGGNIFARIIGGLYKVHDCTSGYRAFKTSILKHIDYQLLSTKGYAFQSTLLYEMVMRGAKVKEEPIVFYDRRVGQSKLSSKDMIEFFLNSVRLRLRGEERFTKFAAVGAAGAVLNTLLLWLFVAQIGSPLLVGGALAIEAAIIFNFIFNDRFTFHDNVDESSFWQRLLRFNAVAAYGFVVNLSVLYLLVRWTPTPLLIANLAGIFIATAWNYLAVSGYTWRVKNKVYYTKGRTFTQAKSA